jgi:hypothetical protein
VGQKESDNKTIAHKKIELRKIILLGKKGAEEK